MIEVEATVHLPRLGAGRRAIVDETDEAVARRIRAGLLVPTGREIDEEEDPDE